MNSPIAHIQINVSSKAAQQFYKDLLTYLKYDLIAEFDQGFGMQKGGFGLWVTLADPKYLEHKFHRKNVGINHMAFMVENKEAVDEFCEKFLKQKNIQVLYDSPKTYPEYTPDYYAVFFEDLDRIKLEVVFHT